MSSFVCGNRKQADQYSSSKSAGQFALAASLIVDDIKDLYDVVEDGTDSVQYFWALVVVIGVSLLLQLISMVFATILYFSKYPQQTKGPARSVELGTGNQVEMSPTVSTSPDLTSEATDSTTDSTVTLDVKFSPEESESDQVTDPLPPRALRRMNDGLTILTAICAFMHVIKTGLQTDVMGGMMMDEMTAPSTASPL